MSMTLFIQLTSVGASVGTAFDLYSDQGTPALPYTVAFESNVDVADLLAGYTTYNAPDGTTIVRLLPLNGSCTDYYDIPISNTTTTTTTGAPADTIFAIVPAVDEGAGSNPQMEYWSSQITGEDVPLTVEITATETAHVGGAGQLYVSTSGPTIPFASKVWSPIISPYITNNPYTLSFIGGTPIYFSVIAGSTPGDSTEMTVEITSTSVGSIGTYDTIVMTSST